MVSKYFIIKTESEEFKTHFDSIFSELKDKKVILYGAGEGFVVFDKKYHFKEKLDIVGISDKKFEKNAKGLCRGFRKIPPDKIYKETFDAILITNERSVGIKKYLTNNLKLDCDIKSIFIEDIKDEQVNLNYLYEHKFNKTLPKLVKELKDKKVVLYGAGAYLELINKYFDLSKLNIIAVADKRFDQHQPDEKFLNWNACSVNEILELKPDCVLVTTKFYIDIIRSLRMGVLKDTPLRPLVKKSFFALLHEIWD